MRHLVLILFVHAGSLGVTSAQDTLLLFHPTAYNLEVIRNLSEDQMLDLEGYHVLGVYHSGEKYPYDSARAMLKEIPGDRFSLREIKGSLEAGNLFGPNDCTRDFTEIFEGSRGALFMGGPDIPPSAYDETVHLLTRVTDPFRHYLELSYLFHLLGGHQDPLWNPFMEKDTAYLISGICLGMQSINVATGGALIQDIPTEVYRIWSVEKILELPPDQVHRNYADMIQPQCKEPTSYHFHRIRLKGNSFFGKGMDYSEKPEPMVLSSHHQAVEILGKGVRNAATSMDGKIIEAIEHESYPNVVGVQFHPEKPGLFDPDIIHPVSCGDSIRFHEVIRGTASFEFHKAYWRFLGTVLQQIRK